MRVALVLSIAFLLAVSPAAWAAGTRSESATYHPSPELFGTSSPPFHFGLVLFPSYGSDTSVTVFADDASGLPVSLFVCQDVDGDNTCGETGEPNVAGCGSLTIGAAEGFAPGRDVNVVYNNVFRFFTGGCQGAALASTGTLTATFTTQ